MGSAGQPNHIYFNMKILNLFFIGILSICFISSCSKEDAKSISLKEELDVENRTLADDINNNVYDYHYQGLLYAKTQVVLSPKPSIITILDAFNSGYSNYSSISVNGTLLSNVVTNKSNLEPVVTSSINKLNDVSSISTEKKNKLTELKSTIFNLQLTTAYRNSITSKISTETDQDVKAGYNLLLSSFDFWIGEITDNDDDVQAIQLDAAGYIIGWVHSVYEDYNNGTLDPSGQGRRMRAGAACGLACSIGKWF